MRCGPLPCSAERGRRKSGQTQPLSLRSPYAGRLCWPQIGAQRGAAMTEAPPTPQAYLLRLWPASSAGTRVWRVSVVNVHTGERYGFADLASLVAFLAAQTDGTSKHDDRPPPNAL